MLKGKGKGAFRGQGKGLISGMKEYTSVAETEGLHVVKEGQQEGLKNGSFTGNV